MPTVFISNHPQGRNAKVKVNGRPVVFVNGTLQCPDDLVEALKARESFPLYGVHFHLRDLDEPAPAVEEAETIHQGARGTSSFKTTRRHG